MIIVPVYEVFKCSNAMNDARHDEEELQLSVNHSFEMHPLPMGCFVQETYESRLMMIKSSVLVSTD